MAPAHLLILPPTVFLPAPPRAQFPSPYMTSWSNGKQTKDELATVELIDSSVLPGFGAAQLSARRVTLAPCTTSPLHVHPHGDEIVLVRRGKQCCSLQASLSCAACLHAVAWSCGPPAGYSWHRAAASVLSCRNAMRAREQLGMPLELHPAPE